MSGTIVDKSVAATWFGKAIHGFEAVTITNYTTDLVTAITNGSKIEISGELYEFTSTTISGFSAIANGTQTYIKFVPAGDECTVEYTTTAPTWSDEKQGWYGTGASANHRYLFDIYKAGATSYENKSKRPVKSDNRERRFGYIGEIEEIDNITQIASIDDITTIDQIDTITTIDDITNAFNANGGIDIGGNGTVIKKKNINIGDWNMDSTLSVSVNHGLTFDNILSVTVIIINDAGSSLYPIDFINVGTSTVPSGSWSINTTQVILRRSGTEFFDNAAFDSTSYNRGFIYIVYEA